MDGSAPFPAMTAFRTSCFQSFPVTHVERMTLSQVLATLRARDRTRPKLTRARQILQLYVAAYQPQAVWKEAWKHLIGVISVQIIRDVEAFVATRPIAEAEVMHFIAA